MVTPNCFHYTRKQGERQRETEKSVINVHPFAGLFLGLVGGFDHGHDGDGLALVHGALAGLKEVDHSGDEAVEVAGSIGNLEHGAVGVADGDHIGGGAAPAEEAGGCSFVSVKGEEVAGNFAGFDVHHLPGGGLHDHGKR